MNELGLLKKLLSLEYDLRGLEIQINIWSDETERKEFEKEYVKVLSEIEDLKIKLVEVEDKKSSFEAHQRMIDQLSYYQSEVQKAKPFLSLSRCQGLMGDNELFSGLSRDMYYQSIDQHSIRIPAYLLYTTNPDDAVEISEFLQFLGAEIDILKSIETPDFLKLREYLDQFNARMIAQFI